MSVADAFELLLLVVILVAILLRNNTWKLNLGRKKSMLVLDSCGLIDGRIEQLLAAHVLNYDLVLPDYVLSELQMLADGRNNHKRLRALHGLEVARRLQDNFAARIHTTQAVSERTVDDRLLNTCKVLAATLYTTDVPLCELAAIQRVQSINVNELSISLRPTIVPGDTFTIVLLRKGDGRNQAIGYAEDGSMVVVDGVVPKYIGKHLPVKATGSKDSTSGRIIFAVKQ